MLRISETNVFHEKDENGLPIQKYLVEASGLHEDTKPTDGIVTGSIFTEVDTGKVFFFDEDGAQWVEQFSFQG